jgi:hypothetical protein
MIARYMVLAVESNNESNTPFMPAYFVNTGFFTGEFCVLTRQAELRVKPTVAFYLPTFTSAMCVNWWIIESEQPLSVRFSYIK